MRVSHRNASPASAATIARLMMSPSAAAAPNTPFTTCSLRRRFALPRISSRETGRWLMMARVP